MTTKAAAKGRLYYMDWLRIVATLGIIVFHFAVELGTRLHIPPERIPHINLFGITLGELSVAIFFILSGAALMYVYGGTDRLDKRTFFLKRALDIYPQFYVAYLISFFALILMGDMAGRGAAPWTFVLTVLGLDGYLQGLGGAFMPSFYLVGEWFVGCILLLYLLFPLLLAGIKKKPAVTACVILALFFFGTQALSMAFPMMPKGRSITVCLLYFAAGMYFIRFVKAPSWKLAIPSACVLAIMTIWRPAPDLRSVVVAADAIAAVLLFGWLFSLITSEKANRAATAVSGITFAVFLVHHRIIVRVIGFFNPQGFSWASAFEMFAVILVASTLMALVVWWLGGAIKKSCKKALKI